MSKSLIKASINTGVAVCLIFAGGCSLNGGPRPRMGYLSTATFGIPFPDPNNLGTHSYEFDVFSNEVGGIVYTCRGGDIDLDHVRGNADDTRFLIGRVRSTLSDNRTGFSFTLTGETSEHIITFTYPADWDSRPDKEKIIDEIAYCAAPRIALDASAWHEILTWFGVRFAIIDEEFNSAFSWEDVYSNVVGVRLGVEAVKDKEHSYDEAMTILIYKELKELGAVSSGAGWHASDKMRNIWYTGNFTPDMKMRNFDIGLSGYATPVLVPDAEGCGNDPMRLPVPNLDVLKHYGFSMTHEIKPNVLQQGTIFKAAGSKKIFAERDYPALIKYMEKEAQARGDKYQD